MFLSFALDRLPLVDSHAERLLLRQRLCQRQRLVGSLGVALFVGQSFYRDRQMPVSQQFLVGLAILTVLALIPFVGWLVVLLVNMFGLEVISLWQFGREKPQIAA